MPQKNEKLLLSSEREREGERKGERGRGGGCGATETEGWLNSGRDNVTAKLIVRQRRGTGRREFRSGVGAIQEIYI